MSMFTSYCFNLITALATIFCGYAIASRPSKWVTLKKLNGLMAFGAGFLLSIVFFEMLPLSMRASQGEYYHVFQFAFLGMMFVFAFDRWIAPSITFWNVPHVDDGCAHHHDYQHDHGHDHASITGPKADHTHASCGHAIIGHGAACSAIGCLIVCSFFDGIAYSSAMAKDSHLGVLVLTAQLFHVIPEGILASSLVLASKGGMQNAKRAALITGVCFMLGALVPGTITYFNGPSIDFIQFFFLAFSSGILLYVGLSQLIPATSESKLFSSLVLAGAAFFLLVHLFMGHAH